MNKIILPTLLLVSLNSFAFEWHGFKSGMTEDEVQKLTSAKYASACDWQCRKAYFEKRGTASPPRLWQMGFSFTSESKLWRIQMDYLEGSGTYGEAQTKILEELFPDVELQNRSESGSYGSTDYVVAMLVDRDLFEEDIERIYNNSKDKY
tara:strand:- start:1501 stop:1950 length:450 start_codon:yes stop_codon:yes gene_type:complete